MTFVTVQRHKNLQEFSLADYRRIRKQTYGLCMDYLDTDLVVYMIPVDFCPQEGAFLVRDCSKSTTYEPLVLAVFYDKRVFNIQIRFSDETSKYSLGTGLRTNDVSHTPTERSVWRCISIIPRLFVFQRFDSVTDIIRFHSIFPIVLIDGRKPSASANQRRQCVLMYPITKQDLTELLK